MSTAPPTPPFITTLLDNLTSLRASTAGSPDGESCALLTTLAGAALDTSPGSTPANLPEALDALEALPESQRLDLLARLQRHRPPSPTLARIARKSNYSAAGSLPDDTPLAAPQRLAIGLWAGLSPAALGLTDAASDLQLATLETFITPTHPTALSTLEGALDQLSPVIRDTAFIAWCERRSLSAVSPATSPDEDIDAEITFFESLSPSARLVCALAILARTPCTRDVAESWIPLCEPGWAAPRDNAGRALADARLAALVGTAGDTASAEGLLHHAQTGLDRENDPMHRAAIYRALFETTAILCAAPHGGPGPAPWFALVDRLTRDRVTLRHRDAYFSARRAASATLPRATLAGQQVADRGHESIKDLIRRLPERWLELYHLATAISVWQAAGRDPEIHLAALSDLLRKDGLPPVDPRIDLGTITALIARGAPSRLATIGERLGNPIQRAWWWSTAVMTGLS